MEYKAHPSSTVENSVENTVENANGKMLLIGKLMRDACMTQTELAYRAGISAQHVSQLETGRRYPRMNTARNLADALGYDGYPYDLFKPYEPKEAPVCEIEQCRKPDREQAEREVRWEACLGPVSPFKAGKLGDRKAQAVKVVEEASELLYAVAHGYLGDIEEELGDVIQAAVNLAFVVGINTEQACVEANARNRERGRL